ncbi:FtsW/RodA/SpoVE family cell cycle protein [Paenibacillus piri]|uniref:Rod shape-determining protein RodA n=1 Tax=Paenibacillus piri TaxID=2547395 RepID=A0A4R5KQ79_9BACL|nr:FtsW/RodA/SpoVE family cell cycle protein [Paenibacillus piri]TDF97165.1 rod shape-determining protein RodA [Paenibacillus piri]
MLNKLKLLDVPILFILIIFLSFSTIVIYSATFQTSYEGLHKTNLITFGVLFIPMIGLSLLDYRVLINYFSYILYGVGILLLLLVSFKGVNLNGSQRWISLGGFAFQPSELMKLFLIMALSKWLKPRGGLPIRLWPELIPAAILTAIPFYLVLKQPDLGTSIVFLCIFIGVLWIGNLQWKHILIGVTAVASFITGMTLLYFFQFELFSAIVKPHQLQRIQTFLDPLADPDRSWHVVNSIRAIGTGQLSGEGFLSGVFIRGGYIPYSYADSIFVVIGEEFGFLGCSLLLLLYFFFLYRMVRISMYTEDVEGRYLIIGVISMFTLQIFENIAMHVGLMPLTGIALPFVSYGGSSLMTNMLAMGMVLSVKLHSRPFSS